MWFRQDLRLADNPAFQKAAAQGPVLPVFILDDKNAGHWAHGGANRVWLHHSLSALNQQLGGKLRFFSGDAGEILEHLVSTLSVQAVYWNRCYEPWRIERDAGIKDALRKRGIDTQSFNGSLLWEPWTCSKKDASPYRVFTPFYRNAYANLPVRNPIAKPVFELAQPALDFDTDLDTLELLPSRNWHIGLMKNWQTGEAAAAEKLIQFQLNQLADYRKGRDFPDLMATSRLAPHLHFGEISPHQIWHAMKQNGRFEDEEESFAFLRQLGWREFSHHLLYYFPSLPDQNFQPKFDQMHWNSNESYLEKWQQGQTGFPVIDAGMRELRQTGYMHNRVRMLVASFLVKNLGVHWRHGAKWFWDNLLEADLANNSAGWQWCAGTGADAAPYFRIFNPVTQSARFDEDSAYILRYCPELSSLPAKDRHQPWLAKAHVLDAANVVIGKDYPEPVVDLKLTREAALAAFKSLR